MTRRRRLDFVTRACIGMFLVLFGEIVADAARETQTIPEKNFDGTTNKQSAPLTNETFREKSWLDKNGTKFASPSILASASLSSPFPSASGELEKQDVANGSIRNEESENAAKNLVTAGRTGSSDENLSTSASPLSAPNERHAARSDYDSSLKSSADSVPKRLRFGDGLRENIDKSSSANAASKESMRLSRTNNLEAATTSEALITKYEKKRNGTSDLSEVPTVDPEDARRGREHTTSFSVHRELSEEERTTLKDPVEETLSSERFNLENGGKGKENGDGISLLNDTRVNYGQSYKNRTSGSVEPGQKDSGTDNPKEEFEVIESVSHSPSLKIVAREDGTYSSEKPHEQSNGTLENELDDKGGTEVKGTREKFVYNANVNVSEDSGKKDPSVFTNSYDVAKKEAHEVSSETIDDVNDERGTVSTTTSNPGVLPRGRTIAFSGVNEFPSVEEKTSPFAGSSRDTGNGHDYRDKNSEVPSKKNTSGEKLDQKPYPYAKSTKLLPQEHTEGTFGATGTEHSGVLESTSEESSAYENTISRRQESETKFVVTEPSVVIENSIQQFKSTYDKRSGNASGIGFTIQSQSPTAEVTPASLAASNKGAVANGTLEHEKALTGLTFENSRTTSAEGVPRRTDVIDKQREITGKDENFDVTGNGITEISPKSNDPSYGTSFLPDRTANATAAISSLGNITKSTANVGVSTNVDVQTDVEESMLLRSTLNVTETSTEYPLVKLNSTEDTSPTAMTSDPLTNSVTSATVNDTVSPTLATTSSTFLTTSMTSVTANGTSNDTARTSENTWNLTESSTPMMTTTIEYEFVGLTEITDEVSENMTTSKSPTINLTSLDDVTTVAYPTSLKAAPKTNPEDTTTTFPLTSESATTVADDTIFTTSEDQTLENETTVYSTIRSVSPAFFDDRSNSTKDFSDSVTSTGSNLSTTVEVDTADSSEAAYSNDVVSTSSDVLSTSSSDIPSFSSTDNSLVSLDNHDASHPNILTTSNTTLSSLSPNVTTTTASTSTSHLPFVPSTVRPRIVQSTWSSPDGPALTSTERTTKTIQNLSPDDIPLLVRIVIEGSLSEVCPHLPKLAQSLAEILNTEADKPVSDKQIIFYQNPCTESPNPGPTSTDMSFTSVLVYIVDDEGKFDVAKTKMLPNLYKVAAINVPVTIRSFLLVQDTPDSGNAIAVVIICSVAFICLVLLAGLLFIMRKRQTRFNYGERCRPVSLDAYSLDSVSAYNSVRRKGAARSSKRSYGNPTFEDSSAIPSHPLNFAGLSSFYTDVNAINEEFSGIPQVWAKIDELPAGAEVKNRYANVIPLPETRVPLQRVNNDPLSEYINASYVRGPKNATKYYVACQAPMETTVTDFWRMIWEQQSKVIIMLTDLVENGIDKCTEYIPPSEVTDCHRLYGDFQVTLKKRETKEKYAISTLHLKNLENNTFREVFHIWYLWPVNGVQSDGTGLIAILLEARALQRGGPGPIVVHCSPGTGRTGTLIALDLGIRQYEITRTVDVPRVVYTIRRDRAGAVQTKEQYAFIYKALNLYATKLAGGVLEST